MVVEGFHERRPNDRILARVRTEVLLARDSEHLYVAARLYDDPAAVRGFVADVVLKQLDEHVIRAAPDLDELIDQVEVLEHKVALWLLHFFSSSDFELVVPGTYQPYLRSLSGSGLTLPLDTPFLLKPRRRAADDRRVDSGYRHRSRTTDVE